MELQSVVADLVRATEQRHFGKYRAFVVDNADPEKLGRLKLNVPSLMGNDVVTGWAMPCVPYGGKANQGLLLVPEVGAAVWVEFEEGDLEFPIWVGTFWSKPGGDSELPKPDKVDGSEESSVQDPPTRKILKTVAGHTIQLEDASGEEMILIIEGVKRHRIILDGEAITVVEGTKEHIITLDGDGITISHGESGDQVLLDSSGITLESSADVNIKGNNITIEAQAQLTAKGNPVHLNP